MRPQTSHAVFSLGDMLRQQREERGLTQTQLARALGLRGNAFVSRMERGTALPSVAMQAQLAKALGVDASLFAVRVAREASHSTSTALLADISQAFANVQNDLQGEMTRLSHSLAQHQSRIAHLLRMSEMQLLWGLSDKVAFEGTIRSAWVVSPDLELDSNDEAVRSTVRTNLARGVEYRYLIPRQRAVVARAKRMLQEHHQVPSLQVRTLPAAHAMLITEMVVYEAGTSERLGLMVAPTARTDVDCVLSRIHAERLERAFAHAWRHAAVVS
jgi:transcriptional regulator with XRE-family HTH domain